MTLEEQVEHLKEKVAIYRFDYLTGLKQRRDFDHDLRKKWKSGHEFYLVYYDINQLHKCNREKGFAAGDRLIRQVAGDIQHQAVPHQSYRYSGDEFYAICCQEPTHDVENATMVQIHSTNCNSVDEMMEKLDAHMIESKTALKTRRIDDVQ